VKLNQIQIYSLAQVGGQCILVLEEVDGPRLLPIWIGLYEGGAIGMALTDQKFPRPLTHDLFIRVFNIMKAEIQKVVITALKNSTFYAEIHTLISSESHIIDARPSDSIAIALRARCPIYVSEAVFESCPEMLKPISEDEVQDFRKKLETMKPEDFFKDLKSKKDAPSPERPKEDPLDPDVPPETQ